jgi:hypothetical protein
MTGLSIFSIYFHKIKLGRRWMPYICSWPHLLWINLYKQKKDYVYKKKLGPREYADKYFKEIRIVFKR